MAEQEGKQLELLKRLLPSFSLAGAFRAIGPKQK
jgi:hypothetical protein